MFKIVNATIVYVMDMYMCILLILAIVIGCWEFFYWKPNKQLPLIESFQSFLLCLTDILNEMILRLGLRVD